MIKVLHVLGHVPIGGVGSFLINTLECIDRNKIKFDFVMFNSPYSSDFPNRVKKLGGDVHKFESYLSIKNIFKVKREFDIYLKEHRDYDIIHLHAPNLGIFIFPIAKRYGIPVRILHSHAAQYSDNFLKGVRNFIIEIPNNMLATDFLACSEKAGKFLFGKKKFFIARNGIDVKKYEFDEFERIKIRNKMNMNGKIIIGHIGNFLPSKNHIFLLEIFKCIYDVNKNVELFLVGDGPLEGVIKENVEKSQLLNVVKFLGRRTDVNKLIQAFDILIIPSENEGFGIVCIEAQVSGLQCYVSDKVPIEVTATDNIRFISLNSSAKEWANIIIPSLKYNRKDESCAVKELGYDIHDTAKQLQDFYLETKKKGDNHVVIQ